MIVNENVSFTDYSSSIRLPDCSKLAINRKSDKHVTICRHDVIVDFFWRILFLLSILVTDPSFMSISSQVLKLWQFTFKRAWPDIQKSEIPPSVWVLSNIWRLGQVRDTKFGTDVSNEMLLNYAKCQVCSFYRFWVG